MRALLEEMTMLQEKMALLNKSAAEIKAKIKSIDKELANLQVERLKSID